MQENEIITKNNWVKNPIQIDQIQRVIYKNLLDEFLNESEIDIHTMIDDWDWLHLEIDFWEWILKDKLNITDKKAKPLTDRERVITNFCKFLYYEDEISGDIKEELIEKLKRIQAEERRKGKE